MKTSKRQAEGLSAGVGGCSTGKRMYPDRHDAKLVARRMHDSKLKPYRCDECGWFHLGHQPADVRNGTYDKADWLGSKGNSR